MQAKHDQVSVSPPILSFPKGKQSKKNFFLKNFLNQIQSTEVLKNNFGLQGSSVPGETDTSALSKCRDFSFSRQVQKAWALFLGRALESKRLWHLTLSHQHCLQHTSCTCDFQSSLLVNSDEWLFIKVDLQSAPYINRFHVQMTENF